MGFCVCMGSITSCPLASLAPFPPAPGTGMDTVIPIPNLIITPCGPFATCMNFAPFVNVVPLGFCTSLMNPITAAQTSAALGVLTPGPCIPTPVGPWTVTNPTIITPLGPVLTDASTLTCAYGGVIRINFAGQFLIIAS